jgi:3-deoxy-7-phosphoheptulonate synthase
MTTTIQDAAQILQDRRVKAIKPLIPPQILHEDIPITLRAADAVLQARAHTEAVLRGDDDRLVVVVG